MTIPGTDGQKNEQIVWQHHHIFLAGKGIKETGDVHRD